MTVDPTLLLRPISRLAWLTGPIFSKELRVSSRKRRNYLLRSAYVAFLSVFVIFAWLRVTVAGRSGSPVVIASQLPEAGKNVITVLVWFQFITAQVIAVVMLSTAIGAEIRRGTLGVLMTTPINSFQVVMGKLTSKLLQLTVLLAISLPLLALVRVLGGVPWDYVISSLCITAAATLFAGSLSLLLSIGSHQAYTTVFRVFAVYMVAFGVVPAALGLLTVGTAFNSQLAQSIKYLTSPFAAFFANTRAMLLVPGAAGGSFSWPLHCLIMLCVAGCLLMLSVWRVRKAGLGQARGLAAGQNAKKKASNLTRIFVTKKRPDSFRPIKRVTGSPIVWKEMRISSSKRTRAKVLFCSAVIVVVVLTVLLQALGPVGGSVFLLGFLIQGLSILVMARLAVLSGASVTTEKESGTWPVLLAAPLEDKEIIRGKAIAVFRRNIPLLVLLCAVHSVFSLTVAGEMQNPMAALSTILAPVGLAGSILLVVGMGLYFSVRLRTTTAAVASTIGVYLGTTFFCCSCLAPLSGAMFMIAPPLRGDSGVGMWLAPLIGTLIPAGVSAVIGLLLMSCAKHRVRKYVF